MKRQHPKVFWVLLCGVGASAVYYTVIFSILLSKGETIFDGKIISMFYISQYYKDNILYILKRVLGWSIPVSILLHALFVWRILKNHKVETRQGYVKAVKAISIIGFFANFADFMIGNFFSVIGVIMCISLWSACSVQKKYYYTEEEEGEVEEDILPTAQSNAAH